MKNTTLCRLNLHSKEMAEVTDAIKKMLMPISLDKPYKPGVVVTVNGERVYFRRPTKLSNGLVVQMERGGRLHIWPKLTPLPKIRISARQRQDHQALWNKTRRGR
jgi:hypothetical protein